MKENISLCGIDCTECPDFPAPCAGCRKIAGKVGWAGYLKREDCPIYHCCAQDRRLDHCGGCKELPCKLYFNTQDPSTPREEHEANIRVRVERLKDPNGNG